MCVCVLYVSAVCVLSIVYPMCCVCQCCVCVFSCCMYVSFFVCVCDVIACKYVCLYCPLNVCKFYCMCECHCTVQNDFHDFMTIKYLLLLLLLYRPLPSPNCTHVDSTFFDEVRHQVWIWTVRKIVNFLVGFGFHKISGLFLLLKEFRKADIWLSNNSSNRTAISKCPNPLKIFKIFVSVQKIDILHQFGVMLRHDSCLTIQPIKSDDMLPSP